MRLYHVPNSSSQRVLWLLEEIGEPYDLTVLGTRAERVADPAHMARHPMGRVPVLEDDEGPIFESGALLFHIADCSPTAGLIPAVGTHERALVYQWSLFSVTEIQSRTTQIRLFGETDPEGAAKVKEQLLEAIAVLDKALEGRDYLVGSRFTVADLLVSAMLGTVQRLEIAELPPRLGAYVEAMDARPAKKRAEARNP